MIKNDVHDITENKLILLFILDKINIPLTNSQITELVMKDSLMNYFILQQYLSELINAAQIITYEEKDKQFYKLTPGGRMTLSYFENRIPFSIREKILQTISEKKKDFKQSAEIISNYTPRNENEYIVECKIIENRTPLIELKLNVGTKKQAKHICEHWKKNSEQIYSQIISALTLEQNKQ
ncbi:MAG: hypothetical protein PWR27_1870 [Petroclostridium sp.]|uniref:DUF4364 family protein n=1 Tax=Petroclostridium xylanilyticum TaxID=1792311 RepID=UPI0012FF9F1A|nr:DUF4364 family protein [Petroclostridium xylanilyticum]MBZ4644714.1 hypothetical protein [Clostridia bacterium]MDK2811161.1 hypothetical protein [Petroclostridium sp.]